MNKKKKSKNIDFLLENKHYKRLHLLLYLLSVILITILYFLIVLIFSEKFHFAVSILLSAIIGSYIVINRNILVKKISNIIEDKKRNDYKKRSKENLKTTLKDISPKNRKLKLDIKGKVSIKDKIKELTSKNKKKEKKDYIEIE